MDDPANNSEVDVLPPYTWTFQVPPNYVGPLTISAIGRVLGQKTGTAPEAEVTIQVVLPANVTLNAIRVRDDQRILFMRVGGKRKSYVYGQFSDGVERLVSSTTSGTRYEVADPSIAVVDGEGVVTMLATGTTTITITNGDKRLQIEVRPAPAL
ncbi:MAG: Ig-like domain-containing protein [Nitrospirota bacterium]